MLSGIRTEYNGVGAFSCSLNGRWREGVNGAHDENLPPGSGAPVCAIARGPNGAEAVDLRLLLKLRQGDKQQGSSAWPRSHPRTGQPMVPKSQLLRRPQPLLHFRDPVRCDREPRLSI